MKGRRDIFGRLIVVSVVLHVIGLLLLPSGVGNRYGTYVFNPVDFDSRNVVGSSAEPSESSGAGSIHGSTALDSFLNVRKEESPEVPGISSNPGDREVKGTKLRFSDRVGRRMGGSSKQSPRFMDVVRKRISDSCDKHMTRGTRAAGVDRVVVLSISILPSGELESVNVIESSKIATLDKASVEAVKKAAPFPRFPQGLKLPRLKLRIPIRCVLSGEGD
jgi:TonB family protein